MHRGDEILSMGGQPVAGQSDVVLGLLERMTDDGAVQMQLRTQEGAQHELRLQVADAGRAAQADRTRAPAARRGI